MPLPTRRYGSVMNGSSRKSTSDCGVPVLAKLLPSAGYRRCWNFRSLTGFTALGLMEVRPPPASHEPIRRLNRRRAAPSQGGAHADAIYGVVFAVSVADIAAFDEREKG